MGARLAMIADRLAGSVGRFGAIGKAPTEFPETSIFRTDFEDRLTRAAQRSGIRDQSRPQTTGHDVVNNGLLCPGQTPMQNPADASARLRLRGELDPAGWMHH